MKTCSHNILSKVELMVSKLGDPKDLIFWVSKVSRSKKIFPHKEAVSSFDLLWILRLNKLLIIWNLVPKNLIKILIPDRSQLTLEGLWILGELWIWVKLLILDIDLNLIWIQLIQCSNHLLFNKQDFNKILSM